MWVALSRHLIWISEERVITYVFQTIAWIVSVRRWREFLRHLCHTYLTTELAASVPLWLYCLVGPELSSSMMPSPTPDRDTSGPWLSAHIVLRGAT